MKTRKRAARLFSCTLAALMILALPAAAGAAAVADQVHVGVVNFESVWGDPQANLAKMEGFISQAAQEGVELLVFPEMCVTGYKDANLPDGQRMALACAEDIPGPTSQRVSALAVEHKMYIVYGTIEKIPGDSLQAYNTAVICTPQGEVQTYRKIHPVEGDWCKAGEQPLMFDTPWGPVGVSICYDTYATPELERYYAAQGCRLVVNPTASARGYVDGDSIGWQWYYRNRLESIADRDFIFVASANLCGGDGPADNRGAFPGGSVVVGPGEDNARFIRYYAGSPAYDWEGLFHGEIDLSLATRSLFTSDNWQPALYAQWYGELAAGGMQPAYGQDEVVLGVANFQAAWGDKEANLARMKQDIAQAAQQGVDILVFPEMALTGYSDQPAGGDGLKMQQRLAETVPGPSTDALLPLAKQYGMYIVYGLPQSLEGQVYNAAAVLCPDGRVLSYQKIHPVGDETNWCARGSEPLLFDTAWGPVGVSICYDTYAIPELERYYAAKGARILINPTATSRGYSQGKWEWYYRCRLDSIGDRDGLVIASANLCVGDGPEGAMTPFPGGSVISGSNSTAPEYYGTRTGNNAPGVVTAKVDLSGKGFNIIGFNARVFANTYAQLAAQEVAMAASAQ